MEPSSDAVRETLEALRAKQKADQEAFQRLVQSSRITWEAEFLLEFESFLTTPFPDSVLRAGIQVKRDAVWNKGMTIDEGLRAVQQGLTPASIVGPVCLETEKDKFQIHLLQRTYEILRKNLLEKEAKAAVPSRESGPVLEPQSICSRLLQQPGLVHNWKPSAPYYVTYSKYKVLQFHTVPAKERPTGPYWRIPAAWNKDSLPFSTTCPTCHKQNRLNFESSVKSTVNSVSCPSGHYEWMASINKVTPKPANPYKQMIQKAEVTIKSLQAKIEIWKKID